MFETLGATDNEAWVGNRKILRGAALGGITLRHRQGEDKLVPFKASLGEDFFPQKTTILGAEGMLAKAKNDNFHVLTFVF